MIHNPLATMIMIIVFGGKEEESKCMLPCFVNTAGLEWVQMHVAMFREYRRFRVTRDPLILSTTIRDSWILVISP